MRRYRHSGFTLVELMITVAIVGILAAIAIPSYTDYVLRGYLVDATNGLSTKRAEMEQYYQDNRTYLAIVGPPAYTPPCSTSVSVGKFDIVCATAPTDLTYTITATGKAGTSTAGFIYTIDQTGTHATTGQIASWGPKLSASCWLVKKGDTTC